MNERGRDEAQALPVPYVQALDAMRVGIAITSIAAPERRVVYCNATLATMLGVSREEIVGRPAIFFMGRDLSDADRDQLQRALEHDRSCRVTTIHERPDSLPIWTDLDLAPIRDAAGRTTHHIWMHTDITQRIAVEELWHQYEAIVNASRDMLLLINDDGDYEVVNHAFAEAHRASDTDFTNQPLVSGKIATAIGALLIGVIAPCFRGESVRLEEWIEVPTLGRCFLDVRCYPFIVGASNRRYVAVVMRDLTQRKLAEDQITALNVALEERVKLRTSELEVAIQDLEAYNYSIAHDLRAPLRFIEGFVAMFEESYADALDDGGAGLLKLVHDGVLQMDAMIRDLLEYARMSRVALTHAPVDLEALLRDAIQENAGAVGSRTIHFSVGRLPACQGDAVLLSRLFSNLIGNAIKFTNRRAEARIEVGCAEGREEYIYYVRDNGIGFDNRHAQAMFGAFRRLHDATEYEGSGVGLAIVKRIAERHGGRAWAEGVPGEGATFYIALPNLPARDPSVTGGGPTGSLTS